MPQQFSSTDLPLPKGWCDGLKNAVIHTIALASYAITYARGWAVNSPAIRHDILDFCVRELVTFGGEPLRRRW